MIIDRTHRSWGIITLVLAFLAVLAYWQTFHQGESYTRLHETVGGTPLGLAFGILSFAVFVFAALLGWRRKHPSWRLGRLQFWMKGHIWLTFLTVPLILMHAGFRMGGPMTSLLMWVYALVMLSGVYGLILQHVMPRMMRDKLPNEVVFEQIPHIRGQLFQRATEIRAQISKDLEPTPAPEPVEPASAEEGGVAIEAPVALRVEEPKTLIDALDSQILPYLAGTSPRGFIMADKQSSVDVLMVTRIQSEERWHAMVDELRSLIQERQQLDLQTKLQHWLHGWILLHAPVSFFLIILTVWHIVVALFYY